MSNENLELQNDRKSYNQIAKNTSIFAGVQLITILINIIRTKAATILIGTNGTGNLSLYLTTFTMIITFTNFGLSFSTIKFISNSYSNFLDKSIFNRNLYIVRRLVYYTGILGMSLCLIFAKKLSILIFGDPSYTISFILLAFTILIQSIINGEIAILQGIQEIKTLARSNLFSSIIGLILTISLFFLFKLNGIIPSIIITAITGLIIIKYNSRFIKTESLNLPFKEVMFSGFEMIKLGITIMATNLFLAIVGFLTQLYIKNNSSLELVGIYSAGLSLISGYVGLIFTAMTSDFFPRLSSNSDNIPKMNKMVNQQAEFSILIICPILVIMLVSLPLVIQILFTKSFLPVISFLQFSILGVAFQTAHWPIGILIASRGKLKFYFYVVMLLHLISLSTNILFFKYFNLIGLGYAFLLTHIIVLIIGVISSKKILNFKYELEFKKIFFTHVILIISTLFLVKYFSNLYLCYYAIPICIISVIYSFNKLKNKLDIMPSNILFTILNKLHFRNEKQ
jgi:O-antigen/teichoic acid export membrane protein